MICLTCGQSVSLPDTQCKVCFDGERAMGKVRQMALKRALINRERKLIQERVELLERQEKALEAWGDA